MIQYKRAITIPLLLMWLLLLAGIILVVYLSIIGATIIALIILSFLLIFTLFEIRGLIITTDGIIVDKYDCYGCRRKRISINRQSDAKAELFVNADIDGATDDDSPIGLIVFLIPFFYKKHALWIKTLSNKTVMMIKLTKKEFDLINSNTQLKMHIR